MEDTKNTPIGKFIAKLGEQEIADSVGVGVGAVRMARKRERLPARWFDGLEGLCRSRRVKLDRNLFDFAKPEPAA